MASNAGVSWADAGRFGADLWVLGHFGWMYAGEDAGRALVTLSPLGIALISVFACAALAHSTSARGWPLVAGGVTGFGAVTALIAWVVAGGAAGAQWPALFGGLGAAVIGLIWGNRPHPLPIGGTGQDAWRLPAAVRTVLQGAVALAALVVAASAVAVVVAMIGGHERFRELFASLGTDLVGGVALILLCVLLVPNALAWGVAYLSGAGFAAGSGTWFSPFDTVGGTEPALPVLGFLPTTAPPAWMALAVAAPVAAGWFVGWSTQRRLRGAAKAWWHPGWAALAAGLLAAVVLATLVTLGSGALGPDRMRDFGAAWWPLLGWLALELGGGAAIGAGGAPRPGRAARAGGQPGFGEGSEALG
jgi:hypothetical protein